MMRRQRRWVHRNWRALLFALAGLCLVASIAMNRSAITQIQEQRQDLTEVDCSLSTLVQASLESGSFGAEIDPDQLTDFEQAVIAAIVKVQLLIKQEDGASQQLAIFRRELRQLRARTNCEKENARDRRAAETDEAVHERRPADANR